MIHYLMVIRERSLFQLSVAIDGFIEVKSTFWEVLNSIKVGWVERSETQQNLGILG